MVGNRAWMLDLDPGRWVSMNSDGNHDDHLYFLFLLPQNTWTYGFNA